MSMYKMGFFGVGVAKISNIVWYTAGRPDIYIYIYFFFWGGGSKCWAQAYIARKLRLPPPPWKISINIV